MSLAAAMLMGASAYALDDIKVSGEAKLWYQTADLSARAALGDTTDRDLFDRKSSIGDASLAVGVSGKAGSAVSFNVEVTALDTLGLENNLVWNTAAGTMNTDNEPVAVADGVEELVSTQWWTSQANVIVNLGKTTAVLGRQALDTPLAFTEKWNVVQNTFDAAVIVNGDLPNTTLVGAYVGKENSALNGLPAVGEMLYSGGTVNHDGEFQSYAANLGKYVNNALGTSQEAGGAYAVGAVFAGIPDVTLQGWYYNVLELAGAFWLQADAKVAGIDVGAQYANVNLDAISSDIDSNSAYAFKLGYAVAGVNLNASYSSVSDDNPYVGFNNVTTQNQTKLYTGAGLNGMLLAQGWAVNVAAPDTDAFTIGASTTAAGATLLAEYTSAETGDADLSTWAVAAVTNVVGIDLLAGVTGADLDGTDVTAVRVTAGLKF
jgi:hypothetical protein